MGTDLLAAKTGGDASALGTGAADVVVEVALLLPANRMAALVALSRRKRQSVGQLLRGLIDEALAVER